MTIGCRRSFISASSVIGRRPGAGVAGAGFCGRMLIGRSPADERGGVWGTGRFPTTSRRRGFAGETWFPPRTRARGERCSWRISFERDVVDQTGRADADGAGEDGWVEVCGLDVVDLEASIGRGEERAGGFRVAGR